VDYSLPAGSSAAGYETTGPTGKEDATAAPRRPASLEVKTEPPVIPPGVPAPVEPRRAVTPPDSLSIPLSPVDSLEDTRPHVVSTITNMGQLEPVSPALSLLNYTCVLVPRLPPHYLTGELADRLAGWVQQLCLAFGWRLEGISIRPEYLQWTVQVVPAISPGNLVRIIRQRTSQHIFVNYAHLAEQNPSGDFWAPGYLIVSGVQPPSAQLLREYIAQTRKRQGVNK
jgi:REP element-mobilizing transposase RayT